MRFVDEAEIDAVAGHGGPGVVSFRHETHVAFGGPDGGDGGRGGNVVVIADQRVVTLLDHKFRRWYKATSGTPGGGSRSSGASGADLEIHLPIGTVITDAATGELVADLMEDGERVVIASGGRGGRGNHFFKSATRQAPRHAQPGEPGEERKLELSLKLVADVGLLGLPNAGKSTLIRAATRSKAKVAAYPFTTLVPNLGVARVDETDFVIADIPGLVPGASQGHGLGDRFLKHVQRTRVLIHLLSLSPDATSDPLEAYDAINAELAAHSTDLAGRPQVVVLNKVDCLEDRYEVDLWRDVFSKRGVELMACSGITGEGVQDLLRATAAIVRAGRVDETEPAEPEPWSPI